MDCDNPFQFVGILEDVTPFENQGEIENVAISPDGNFIALVMKHDKFYKLNIMDNEMKHVYNSKKLINAAKLAWSHDSMHLYAYVYGDGYSDLFQKGHSIERHSRENNNNYTWVSKCIYKINSPFAHIIDCTTNVNGLIAFTCENCIKIIDMEGNHKQIIDYSSSNKRIRKLQFSGDGQILGVTSDKCEIYKKSINGTYEFDKEIHHQDIKLGMHGIVAVSTDKYMSPIDRQKCEYPNVYWIDNNIVLSGDEKYLICVVDWHNFFGIYDRHHRIIVSEIYYGRLINRYCHKIIFNANIGLFLCYNRTNIYGIKCKPYVSEVNNFVDVHERLENASTMLSDMGYDNGSQQEEQTKQTKTQQHLDSINALLAQGRAKLYRS